MSSSTHSNDPLVQQLLALLSGGQAHATLAEAVKDFPEHLRGVAPEGLPYSAWQLLEHLRIAQRDILDFCAPPESGYKPLNWPGDYWPAAVAPPSPQAWDNTLSALKADSRSFAALLNQPGVDLYSAFAWGEGQNLLREALLIANHNSYHIGELVLLRRLLGTWSK